MIWAAARGGQVTHAWRLSSANVYVPLCGNAPEHHLRALRVGEGRKECKRCWVQRQRERGR